MHRKLCTLLLGGTLLLGSLSPLPIANAQVINAQGQPSADYNVSWQKGNDDAAKECANGYVPQYKPAPTLPYANASEAYDAGYNNGLDYSQPCLKVKYTAAYNDGYAQAVSDCKAGSYYATPKDTRQGFNQGYYDAKSKEQVCQTSVYGASVHN